MLIFGLGIQHLLFNHSVVCLYSQSIFSDEHWKSSSHQSKITYQRGPVKSVGTWQRAPPRWVTYTVQSSRTLLARKVSLAKRCHPLLTRIISDLPVHFSLL